MGGILLGLLFAVLCFLPLGKTEKPSLNVSENHIDVPVGSTLYLKCNGTHPLAWKFRYSVNQQESSLKELRSLRTSLFESIIHLEFSNYAMTGRYICFYNNASNSDFASVYIFVNSVGQLLLPVDGYPFEVLFIHDAKITVVPCLPTNSSAEVSLRKSTASATDLNSGVDFCANATAPEENLPYEPTEGFKISHSTSYYRGPFCCEAKLGGFKENIVFIFGSQSTKLKAMVFRQETGYFVVNSTFSFDCFQLKRNALSQSRIFYGWSYPAAAAKRIRTKEISDEDYVAVATELYANEVNPVRLKELNLDSAQKSDGGFFRCSVMSYSYEVYITEVFVRIYDKEEYPYLKPEGASVEFKADYRTFPSFLEFTWMKENTIIFEIPGKYEIFQKDGSYILRVHNVSADDSGTYVFRFANDLTNSRMFFRFSVLPGTPKIYTSEAYNEDSTDFKLICKRQYLEWSRLEWIWRPLCDYACDTSVKPEIIFKEIPSSRNIQQYVYSKNGGLLNKGRAKAIVLTMKDTISVRGDYFCRGINEFGSTDESVLHRNTKRNSWPQDFPPVLEVNQTEELTLSCVANKSLFESVEIWRKLGNRGSFEQVNSSFVSVKMENLLKANYPFGMIDYGDTGTYRCSATYRENSSRVNEKSVFIFVSDYRNRFIYFTNMDAEEVLGYVNETFELFCYVGGDIRIRIEWDFMGKLLSLDKPGITLADDDQKLVLKHLEKEHEGIYECRVSNEHNTEHRQTKLLVMAYPRIWKTNMNSSTVVAYPMKYLDLFCYVDDLRGTSITWYLNNRTIDDSVRRVKFGDHFQKLHIEGLTEENSGVYECRAENKVGFVSASMTLLIKKAPERTDNSDIISFTFSGILLVLILSSFLILSLTRRYRRRKFQNIARKALLVKDETSSDEDVFDYEASPEDTMLCNQVLPDSEELATAYDKKLEFPKHRLQFGKSLGSGEFGRVVKAKAIGIKDFEPTTTVAVKMVKDKGNPMHKAALMKELKILMLLGYHLNIMNLLGAVTRSPKGLLIIVEYCRHGNLLRFLLKHRTTFIPQDTDLSENAEKGKQMRSLRQSTELQDEEKYSIALEHFSWDTAKLPEERITEKTHSTSNSGCISESIQTCPGNNTGPCGVTGFCSSGSIPAEKCRKTKRSRKHRLCFSDLICYAFQCARGMSYLASKKLIHRDLAARNILLAEGNVIKICDFGLTKDIYNYPNYVPSKDTPLPFKWMAIESLADGVFTTKSDIWSFGVVLWELFSLGMHPYPDMPTDERFYGRLKKGYRMDKPEFATDDIYQIMSNCWRENPGERPNFSKLTETLGELLEDAVREHYVNMNEPYARRNELAAVSHQEESGVHTTLENFADIKMENKVVKHSDTSEVSVNNQGDVETTSEVSPQVQSYSP